MWGCGGVGDYFGAGLLTRDGYLDTLVMFKWRTLVVLSGGEEGFWGT